MTHGQLNADDESNDDESDNTSEVLINERKFNATATLNITAHNEAQAETAARGFFEQNHGSRPSKVVVSEDEHQMNMTGEQIEYTVMVADHSSGSLTSPDSYELHK